MGIMSSEPLARSQLLKVADSGQRMPGPSWRRIDCLVPGIGVETWATMVEMGGPSPRYTLEDIHGSLADAGHPPLFKAEDAALEWLAGTINGAPIAVDARAMLDQIAAEEAAKTERKRVEDLLHAEAVVAAAKKRASDTEGS